MALSRKEETISLRMDTTTRDLISRAAAVRGKSLSAFMTEAAYASAQQELLDQRFVGVNAEVFDAVETMLAEPAAAHPALARLLAKKREWID